MRAQKTFARWMTGALLATGGLLAATTHGHAQDQPPVLVLIDASALDIGDETHRIPTGAANEAIAAVGLRDALPFFAARAGSSLVLPGGVDGNDGWFAIRSVPAAWDSEAGAGDGLQNFALAGAGLGSPDENGDRTSLLTAVPDVAPMKGADLGLLVGRTVCAVVYRDDIAAAPGTAVNLSGVNLGMVALRVTAIDGDGSEWGGVVADVLDTHETCSGALTPLQTASTN